MNESKEEIRLNKFLSDSGVCSRREADRLIEKKKVTVDGAVAVLGMKIRTGQEVICDGVKVKIKKDRVLIALNKPVGIECTTSKEVKDNIVDFVGYPTRIYPVGRLDKNSEGLIFLTNDGSLVNEIMKASKGHEKEYIVRVDKKITLDFLKKMREGIPILDTITKPCIVEKINAYMFRIILTQGLNRQIRRMCEYLEYNVINLKRIRIMNVYLGELEVGKYRLVTEQEMFELKKCISRGKNNGTNEGIGKTIKSSTKNV